MGLRLTCQTDYGITADYLHIGATLNEFSTQMCQVTLLLYANYDARMAGGKPLGSHNIALSGAEYPGDVGRAALYAAVKLRQEFAAAEDC